MNDRNKLFDHLAREEEQKQLHKEAIREALTGSTIPVPDEVRYAVANLFVTDAMDVLRAHPGFDLEDKIRSIRTALKLFGQAFTDLMAALDAFDAFSRQPEFFYRSHCEAHAATENRIRKEIFTFSELAHSLQDHCRRLKKRWEHSEIEDRISHHFESDGLHDFVCGLRRALHHLLMVEANWLIRGSGTTATSHFVFDRRELMAANPDWNVCARHYLESCDEEIDFRGVAQAYHPRVHAFYDWLLGEVDTAPPPKLADYRRCWNAHQQRNARLSWHFLLMEFLKREIDPYDYLERYLVPTELKIALQLPRHSRAQADFVIQTLDEFSVCDDEIRTLAYKLFRVP